MSIRSLESRIDELLTTLKYYDDFIDNERRISTITRLETVITTREQLISSFKTASKWNERIGKGEKTYNPFNNAKIEYSDLRSQVQKLLDEYKEVK